MTIAEFAKKGGITKLAERMDLTHQSVWSWTVYRQCPKPEHMEEIFKLSRGKVTHLEMVKSYLKNRKPMKPRKKAKRTTRRH